MNPKIPKHSRLSPKFRKLGEREKKLTQQTETSSPELLEFPADTHNKIPQEIEEAKTSLQEAYEILIEENNRLRDKLGEYRKSNKEVRREIYECKDCQLAKMDNPKHPICNYHQGFKEGQKQKSNDVLKLIDEANWDGERGWSIFGEETINKFKSKLAGGKDGKE